jgi:hypothetical protein
MSETQQDQDRTYWTGDRENYKELQRIYHSAVDNEHISADAMLIASAIRAGLAEIAVEIHNVAGFGIDQASRRKSA